MKKTVALLLCYALITALITFEFKTIKVANKNYGFIQKNSQEQNFFEVETAQNTNENNDFAENILTILQAQNFVDVFDTNPYFFDNIHQTPNVDLAVIELNQTGEAVNAANVLLSPSYPDGIVVPLSKTELSTKNEVNWQLWDSNLWDENHGVGDVSILPETENAAINFMSPYPASVMKLMVAFGVFSLVDQNIVTLTDVYNYVPETFFPSCTGNHSDRIYNYLDKMITTSDNLATCALIKMLHDENAITELNQTLRNLELDMLQLNGTDPASGAFWENSVMNSLDTAKLLFIIAAETDKLWSLSNGEKVTKNLLSDTSRQLFNNLLKQQAMNFNLSTSNWCGADYPTAGIPQIINERWIDVDDTVTVADNNFGQEVSTCNQKAEVVFYHKNGWADINSMDAGIVRSLPGEIVRNYIIVVSSNLGSRYIDIRQPETQPGSFPILNTEKFASLGKAVDDFMKEKTSLADFFLPKPSLSSCLNLGECK